jgi:hypothetical protein
MLRSPSEHRWKGIAWIGRGCYAGTEEEGEQNTTLAWLMAEDLLLSYIGDAQVTAAFDEVRGGYSP